LADAPRRKQLRYSEYGCQVFYFNRTFEEIHSR